MTKRRSRTIDPATKPVTSRALTVAVLMGGPDGERPVSLMSGAGVCAALEAAGVKVLECVVSKPTPEELRALEADVVFPVLHGRWGEGGPLQQRLEASGKPYVGSGPIAAALAMDKLATKSLAAAIGIPTPKARELRFGESCELDPPLVVKPVDDGSSLDLAICATPSDFASARERLEDPDRRFMAEALVAGHEVTVGILDGAPLPLIAIQPADGHYDYDAKYVRNDTSYVVDPRLADGVAERCRRMAAELAGRIGCRHLARVDFMVDEDGPWLLEVNTMPGFTSHSLLPMAAAAAGHDMPSLCRGLAEMALREEGREGEPPIPVIDVDSIAGISSDPAGVDR